MGEGGKGVVRCMLCKSPGTPADSALIRRRCHLRDRACVSNSAHATTRRGGRGRGRHQRGSGQGRDRERRAEERTRADTLAKKAGEKMNACHACIECWPIVHP